jgi:uncharacterized protein
MAAPLKWVLMFAPLIMVFAFGAVINRMSAAGAQLYFYVYAALMGLSLSSIFLVFTGDVDRADLPDHRHRLCGPVALWLHHQEATCPALARFLMMGLIGLIVAMLVNIFLDLWPAARLRDLGARSADLCRSDRL